MQTAKRGVPAVVFAALLLWTPGRGVQAQCCGDCNGDGRVTIDELVAAVGRALDGCAPPPATGTPTPSLTPRPTPTPTLRATVTSTVRATPTRTPSRRATLTPTPTGTATATPTRTRFVDNGDGTITDTDTGLLWEKKVSFDTAVDGFELHDADNRYSWWGRCGKNGPQCRTDGDCAEPRVCRGSDKQRTGLTIFLWLDELNHEGGGGFAGFDDWRIPTVTELRTLRAAAAQPPLTDAAFNADACGVLCADLRSPACSCTAPDPYWSATDLASDPTQAWRVNFLQGEVLPNLKSDALRVRAVRSR